MRTIVKALVLSLLLSSTAFAGVVISPSSLPEKITNFVRGNFPDANILFAKKDFTEYELQLSDATEIEFGITGEWKEIKSYNGINPAILGQEASSTISKNYPGIKIVKIEKEWNGFEVKLANMMKLYLDNNGNLIGQKYDD